MAKPKKALRVVIAAETIPGIGGGLGYFLFNAVRALATARPSWQFKVVACASFIELERIKLPNVKIVCWDRTAGQRITARVFKRLLPTVYVPGVNYQLSRLMPLRAWRASLGDLKAMYRGLRGVDVIWAPHFTIGSESLSLEKNLSPVRAPILFTIHDIHPAFFPDDWTRESTNNFWNGFAAFARRSRCIITHTEFQKKAIAQHLKINLDRIAVTPCPPLIDRGTLRQTNSTGDVQEVLSRFKISAPFALYPGSTGHTHKNHTRLLLAWAALRTHLGDRCPALVCTAKGHLWPALKALVEALEIQDKVVFTDTVDTDTLVKLFQSCAFVIVPTLYEGGGSGPVAEALLSGKTVVCSDIPVVREQLHSYGLDSGSPVFFAPDSIDSIVHAVEATLGMLPELESRVREDQAALTARLPGLWKEWAEFYCAQIRKLSDNQT